MRARRNGAEDGALAIHTSLASSLGERVRVTSAGKIGIGTTTPDANLQIMNNDGSSYRFGYGGTSDVYFDADTVFFRTDNGGANTATLKTTGLGIGTTTPRTKLNVQFDYVLEFIEYIYANN